MDAQWAQEVMDRAPFVTVSMVRADGTAYGLPLTLARTDEKTYYFHCAPEGDKLDCLRANPRVCLSAVGRCKPMVGPLDGSFTLEYKSAVGFGTAEVVTDDSEKVAALRAICQRFLPQNMGRFDESIARSLGRTCVVRITLSEPLTGKRKQYGPDGKEIKST